MHLLQFGSQNEPSLTTFDDRSLPPYAILSHTWGADDDEVTYDDVKRGHGSAKTGHVKIMFCGKAAKQDDLKHFWIDSCCINKQDLTELSESINSMFRWYEGATKCYVYLQDVSTSKRGNDGQLQSWEHAFRKSRWFRRGWTLQELLAPKVVEFWSRDGQYLGDKIDLKDMIHEITGIPVQALLGAPLSAFSTNERMRWAAFRETTKREDKAYCLLGLFGVFLSPIYGEGDHAFVRLREEIEKTPNPHDDSAFDARREHSSTPRIVNLSMNRLWHQRQLEQYRKECLASLDFDQIDARYANIKDAQRTTCEWLLHHPAYVAWVDTSASLANQSILWIAGKPGTGKSTIMKYALARAIEDKQDDEIVVSFFFNARGDGLEKTTVGMYRALLFHLLNAAPDLQHVLDDPSTLGRHSAKVPTWTIAQLQQLLRDAVKNLGDRRLKMFIDALDECDIEQVRGMVQYLEELGEFDLGQDSRLHMCFASRHYPAIDIHHGWRLILEEEAGHDTDLSGYIQRRLGSGQSKHINEIRAEVQQKANGVFLWVVLVVHILNEELRRGRIFHVKKRLQEIPNGLSDLFSDILRRDNVDMNELLLCLQWILFAKRPLTREEYYFAMESALHHDPTNKVQWTPAPWNQEEVTVEDMERFVSSSSKGLAELTQSEKAPTVQFIHESVRDFLIRDGGLRELWPDFDNRMVSSSHDKLRRCCAAYLTVDLCDHLSPDPTVPNGAFIMTDEARQTITGQYPFLQYAISNIFPHADEAALDISQEGFLRDFPLGTWVRLAYACESHADCRHCANVHLLYILAEHDCPRLIRTLGNADAWQRHPKEKRQYPVLVAFSAGHTNALEALLGDAADDSLQRIVQDPGFGKAAKIADHDDLLLWMAKERNWSLASCVLTAYSDAGLYSLDAESGGDNALALALKHDMPDAVRLLLAKGADPNTQGGYFGSALQAASYRGAREAVSQLLEAGAHVNARGGCYGTALQAASYRGHNDVVDQLLRAGADMNAWGGCYGTALQAAAYGGNCDVVKQLIDRGAEVDAQSVNLGSALQAASLRGYVDIVRLLLANGADVHARVGGEAGGTALHSASREGHDAVVKLLIDANADVDAKGGFCGTALVAASYSGHGNVVKLLLDAGANADYIAEWPGTALTAALRGNHTHIVKLLRDRGAREE